MSVQNGAARLPQQIETILSENMGVYLLYLKRQAIPPIQENQRLVTLARTKLRRLPSAQALYESVINRVSQDAPSISLDQMLNRKEEGILKAGRSAFCTRRKAGTSSCPTPSAGQQTRSSSTGLSAFRPTRSPGRLLTRRNYMQTWSPRISPTTPPSGSGSSLRSRSSRSATWAGPSGFCQAHCGEIGAGRAACHGGRLHRAQEGKHGRQGGRRGAGSSFESAWRPGARGSAAKAQKEANKAEGALAFSLGQKSPFDDLNATFDPLRSLRDQQAAH